MRPTRDSHDQAERGVGRQPAVSRRDGVVILRARMLAGHLRRRNGNIPAARVTEVYSRVVASLSG